MSLIPQSLLPSDQLICYVSDELTKELIHWEKWKYEYDIQGRARAYHAIDLDCRKN